MSLVFGTCPDSWGVWFADDEEQPPWTRFLDEAATAGYKWIELGPYGYLPTDVEELGGELSRRGLGVIAGTLITVMHVPSQRSRALADAERVARLAAPLGARFVVGIALSNGTPDGPRKLDRHQWRELVKTSNEIGRMLRGSYDLTLTFHPHARGLVEYAAEVDRYLQDTDPEAVQLCLDTGHYEYRDGNSTDLMRRYWTRIPYLHLKSVDARVLERVEEEDLDFVEAVALGAMCEPSKGKVDFEALATLMRELNYSGWAVVEHDMHPLPSFDTPLPIAIRTREYFQRRGWRVA